MSKKKMIKNAFKALRFGLTEKSGSPEFVGNETGDEEVHDEAYGVSAKGRMAAAYLVTLFIIACILTGSFVLAVYLPGDTELISSRAEELHASDAEYTALQEQKETLENEVSEVQASVDEKKESLSGLEDYDNIKAELRAGIEEQKSALISLTTQIADKQTALNGINDSISKRAGAVITLPPGKYVVGTNLPAGKYSVSGTGKFQVASSKGVSKANELLNTAAIEIRVEKDDIIKIESTTKFTPIG